MSSGLFNFIGDECQVLLMPIRVELTENTGRPDATSHRNQDGNSVVVLVGERWNFFFTNANSFGSLLS